MIFYRWCIFSHVALKYMICLFWRGFLGKVCRVSFTQLVFHVIFKKWCFFSHAFPLRLIYFHVIVAEFVNFHMWFLKYMIHLFLHVFIHDLFIFTYDCLIHYFYHVIFTQFDFHMWFLKMMFLFCFTCNSFDWFTFTCGFYRIRLFLCDFSPSFSCIHMLISHM